MKELIYHPTAEVTFATNTFINVPTILQFDQTPLVSVVKEAKLGYTTEFPLYHADGTYLAKVTGTRVYATSEGTLAGVKSVSCPRCGFALSTRVRPLKFTIRRARRFACRPSFTPLLATS